MMTYEQRAAAYKWANLHKEKAEIGLQADVRHNSGFDEVEDGVWVQAWVKVPADVIPGYNMEPPAPASTVKTVLAPGAAWPFPTK